MTFLDVCAGIGGFSLGFQRASMTCVGQVEKSETARASFYGNAINPNHAEDIGCVLINHRQAVTSKAAAC